MNGQLPKVTVKFSAFCRRLDYLTPWLAGGVGFGSSALLGAVVLSWVSPIVGSALFLALLGGAVFVAYSGEPITVVAQTVTPEPVPIPPEPSVPPQPLARGPEMVRIPAGVFHMGSPEDEDSRYENEGPMQQVRLSAFEMMHVPVTRQLYAEVMDSEQPEEEANEQPVNNVTWFDAVRFCNRLSESVGVTPCYNIDDENVVWAHDADGYRLPTEAEWEYACRAGTQTRFFFSDDEQELDRYAWYRENSGRQVHPVGQKEPNTWGLYDMHGNVYEWCWDWYGSYSEASQTDPIGPSEGTDRILRGGAAWNRPRDVRSAVRFRDRPKGRDVPVGLRCVRRPRRQR